VLGFGEPWISGSISLLQGKVDLKFRIEGNKGNRSQTKTAYSVPDTPERTDKATVYFTSIRPTEKSEFQIGMFIETFQIVGFILIFKLSPQYDTRSLLTAVRLFSWPDRERDL
jgi:hypothetical protein